MNNPATYKMMLNKYMVHQNDLLMQKQQQVVQKPQEQVQIKQEPEQNDEVLQLKKRLQELESKEQSNIARKASNTTSKLKGEDPSERTIKMRKAKLTKKQQMENQILGSYMDKDVEDIKKESKEASKKVRLLKRFVKDVEKNNNE